ncbi:UNVERIFIED_CONTAM: hypothetical protein Sradi_3862900 [Sesamum radiatum]|uniref:Uncharacterized protein n=1 Tax=Sesamum radiatum TaxID=300843 RepID=A0AAW2Q1Y3_SESRA
MRERGAAEGTSKLPDGLTLRTGGVTRRAAYAREALSELHDVDNRARPVVPDSIPEIQPFRVHSGAFSIIDAFGGPSSAAGRRRGPHTSRLGLDYLGPRGGGRWRGGCGEKKKRRKETEDLKTGVRGSQKGVQHEDFPGGHPS